jgi:diamine N-acetyltransferase
MKRKIAPFGNEQVSLRLLEKADLDKTLSWRNRDEVRICFKYSSIISPEQHLSWFQAYQEKDDDFVFVVEADGTVVGQVSVYGIDWDSGTAEVGRFLADPEKSGKGYVRAACELLIDMCWSVLGLQYLFLEVYESNVRAVRLYESLGFKREDSDSDLLRFGLKRGAKGNND